MDNTIAISLLTMTFGAILGAVFGPLGDLASRRLLDAREKTPGLHSALVLLLAANAIWVIAEVLESLVSKSGPWTVLALAVLFLFSAIVLFSAYRHIPENVENEKKTLMTAFGYLLFGNFLWILAEVTEMLMGATDELLSLALGKLPTYVRIIISIIATGTFGLGVASVWKLVPAKKHQKPRTTP